MYFVNAEPPSDSAVHDKLICPSPCPVTASAVGADGTTGHCLHRRWDDLQYRDRAVSASKDPEVGREDREAKAGEPAVVVVAGALISDN